ncbi:Transposase and inactivated derivatives%2C TnpA family [Enterobacter cloacae]|uniref:Tn3-family transposase n=1 Tax=Enterobacter cloacae subsp. cloacae (strain ATCC 13047 / DSM 30054 / NBRC 13535 / NCTC 10005 / WDCM 00083 / NCDC 279-56) TaxID=716541 RepID=A0A0H3CUN0_ENTCC|nr:Tn3-family transposase [Enterobacter cloacae subsp. cloacae ATCC 13047]KGB01705.1 tn3 transposase DDE domain protein [Enterobacter cloacae]OOC76436.1 DDE transposase [Enterobacter cloacae]CUJ40058.1 Transposase and inactivated derivatives%2C TnpA family [Enterobacter cloacae]
MPRRSILSAAERESLLALPDTKDELIRHYTFSESDLSIIRQRRGPANRLGFAVQLCYLRFPGVILGADEPPFPPLLRLVANQLKVGIESWDEYGQREQTRREHLVELQTVFGFQPFTIGHYRQAVQLLTELAMQTDKGIVLARALIEHLRRQSVIVPALNAVERASAEAITRANRRLYDALAEPLTDVHRRRLDDLLKIAREGGQMTPADLAKFEPQRRYATLVALAIEGMATVTDEIIDLHDRILGKLFNAAKNKHQQQFQASGKAINAKVRLFGRIGQALIEAKQAGRDPFAAIEAVMSWDAFAESVTEAQRLAQPEDFDFLHRIGESYATLRRYAPEFLDVLKLRAAPAAKDVLDAIEVLRSMNSDNARKVPTDAPTEFIKPRWQKLVMTDTGIDRRYYELCALSELKNALRSGDIWVQGSRQFKDFEDYLVPPAKFASLKQASELPLAVATDCDQYLHDRLTLLETQLATVNRMALANELPDAIITESGLKITPLDAAVPDTAQALIDQTAMILPHVKITELLLEVDEWTGFTRHFAHLKSGDLAKDKNLLLTTILADAINLGLTKMAESCPGTTYAKLAWLQAWHIRDETYGAALAELVNAQFRHPFAEHWGDGTTSSSDGQNFRTGSKAESTGHINPKYGSSPGRTFYTHISDQYAPFHTKVVNVGVRDSTYGHCCK